MSTHLQSALPGLREDMGRFARTEIAARTDMRDNVSFPHDLWGKLAAAKLTGIALPVEFGGRGGNYVSLTVALEAMVRHGHSMGFTLSWMMQEAIGRFVLLPFATDRIKEIYLPRLAGGSAVAALAISEPGVGAHPKHLAASATREGKGWTLSGEKTMITNGPIADFFVVVAVTSGVKGKKAFTAFLVPKTTPGFSLTKPIELGFLQPARHGGIRLDGCHIDDAHMIGTEGEAFRDIALPFRDIEDVLLAGAIAGGFGRLLETAVETLGKEAAPAAPDIKARLGAMADTVDTLRIAAYEAAAMTDGGATDTELPALLRSFKAMAAGFLGGYGAFLAAASVSPGDEGKALINDLDKTIGIADDIVQIRRIKRGDDLLARKE
jgi:alkylation response protein AidB-like acyl-CoA dehydrogenase